jgi:hypothetical protein
MPSLQTSLRYSDLGRGIVRGVYVDVTGVEVAELELRCETGAGVRKRR